MTELITPEIKAWIGKSEPPQRAEVTRREIVKYALATEQRLPKYQAGDEAPPMFLFGLFRPLVEIDALGPDGLAKETMMPELPLKRIMAGGSEIRWHRAIRPGDVLVATRTLTDVYGKQGSSGPLIFVVHELEVRTEAGEPVMNERQTRIVR